MPSCPHALWLLAAGDDTPLRVGRLGTLVLVSSLVMVSGPWVSASGQRVMLPFAGLGLNYRHW